MKNIICAAAVSVLVCVMAGCGDRPELLLAGADGSSSHAEITEGGNLSGADGESALSGGDGSGGDAQGQANIFVYICGAVKNPGVYELQPQSRIYELVDLAGGLTKKADAESVNLAELLTDGGMIRIPDLSERDSAVAAGIPAGGGTGADAGMPAGTGAFAGTAGSAGTGISADGKVNINTAAREQLMTLTGIGETKADSIIAYRTQNGGFSAVDEIMQVEGIKEGTFAKIRDSITVQ